MRRGPYKAAGSHIYICMVNIIKCAMMVILYSYCPSADTADTYAHPMYKLSHMANVSMAIICKLWPLLMTIHYLHCHLEAKKGTREYMKPCS